MICQQCGTENAPGDKFCEHCGAALYPGDASDENIAATMVGTPPSSAVLTRADDAGQTFPLGSRVVVGRLDSCDIPIQDKSVSREHARLSQLPGGYVVEDLGSTNGTMVNGERISEAVILRPGDRVTFGSVEFQFDEERAATPEGLSAASTQPFQYRPPTAAAPAEPQPTATPEPAAQPAPEPQPATTLQDIQFPPAAEPEPAPAFEFPPLQPFAPVQETEQPAAPAAPAPEAPATQASPLPSTPSPVPAAEDSAPEPVKEPAPAAEPPAPSPGVAQVGGDTLPDDAVAAAAHLSDLVQALAQQASEAQSRHAELTDRVQELEAHGAVRNAISAALADSPPASMSAEQLASVEQALDRLSQDPRDIELLMQIGRQANELGEIVRDYARLRDTVQRVQEANSQ